MVCDLSLYSHSAGRESRLSRFRIVFGTSMSSESGGGSNCEPKDAEPSQKCYYKPSKKFTIVL